MGAAKAILSGAQCERLRKVIYDRTGIDFPPGKQYLLEARLGLRLEELDITDYDHYLALLTSGPFQDDEFQEMLNRVTINETSFFRNERQLAVFESTVLPRLLDARKGVKRLRIWSAACSTGEEPFTLAIQVHRTLGVRLADWRIEILGTDISERALQTAAGGRYFDYAMRTTPATVANRYFRRDAGSWKIDDTIRSMVTFERHNLRDTLAARRHGTWDVIFCRNVLIYFDDDMKRRVAALFSNQLSADGSLFIGHSETLRGIDDGFVALDLPEAFCYAKRAKVAASVAARSRTSAPNAGVPNP